MMVAISNWMTRDNDKDDDNDKTHTFPNVDSPLLDEWEEQIPFLFDKQAIGGSHWMLPLGINNFLFPLDLDLLHSQRNYQT